VKGGRVRRRIPARSAARAASATQRARPASARSGSNSRRARLVRRRHAPRATRLTAASTVPTSRTWGCPPSPAAALCPRRFDQVQAARHPVRAGSARHQDPLVLGGQERSRSAIENRRSQVVDRYGLARRSSIGQVRAPSARLPLTRLPSSRHGCRTATGRYWVEPVASQTATVMAEVNVWTPRAPCG
jgi:hypothetical protein